MPIWSKDKRVGAAVGSTIATFCTTRRRKSLLGETFSCRYRYRCLFGVLLLLFLHIPGTRAFLRTTSRTLSSPRFPAPQHHQRQKPVLSWSLYFDSFTSLHPRRKSAVAGQLSVVDDPSESPPSSPMLDDSNTDHNDNGEMLVPPAFFTAYTTVRLNEDATSSHLFATTDTQSRDNGSVVELPPLHSQARDDDEIADSTILPVAVVTASSSSSINSGNESDDWTLQSENDFQPPLPPGVVDDPVLSMADSFVNVFASVGKLLSNIQLPSMDQVSATISSVAASLNATSTTATDEVKPKIMSDEDKRMAFDAEWSNLTVAVAASVTAPAAAAAAAAAPTVKSPGKMPDVVTVAASATTTAPVATSNEPDQANSFRIETSTDEIVNAPSPNDGPDSSDARLVEQPQLQNVAVAPTDGDKLESEASRRLQELEAALKALTAELADIRGSSSERVAAPPIVVTVPTSPSSETVKADVVPSDDDTLALIQDATTISSREEVVDATNSPEADKDDATPTSTIFRIEEDAESKAVPPNEMVTAAAVVATANAVLESSWFESGYGTLLDDDITKSSTDTSASFSSETVAGPVAPVVVEMEPAPKVESTAPASTTIDSRTIGSDEGIGESEAPSVKSLATVSAAASVDDGSPTLVVAATEDAKSGARVAVALEEGDSLTANKEESLTSTESTLVASGMVETEDAPIVEEPRPSSSGQSFVVSPQEVMETSMPVEPSMLSSTGQSVLDAPSGSSSDMESETSGKDEAVVPSVEVAIDANAVDPEKVEIRAVTDAGIKSATEASLTALAGVSLSTDPPPLDSIQPAASSSLETETLGTGEPTEVICSEEIALAEDLGSQPSSTLSSESSTNLDLMSRESSISEVDEWRQSDAPEIESTQFAGRAALEIEKNPDKTSEVVPSAKEEMVVAFENPSKEVEEQMTSMETLTSTAELETTELLQTALNAAPTLNPGVAEASATDISVSLAPPALDEAPSGKRPTWETETIEPAETVGVIPSEAVAEVSLDDLDKEVPQSIASLEETASTTAAIEEQTFSDAATEASPSLDQIEVEASIDDMPVFLDPPALSDVTDDMAELLLEVPTLAKAVEARMETLENLAKEVEELSSLVDTLASVVMSQEERDVSMEGSPVLDLAISEASATDVSTPMDQPTFGDESLATRTAWEAEEIEPADAMPLTEESILLESDLLSSGTTPAFGLSDIAAVAPAPSTNADAEAMQLDTVEHFAVEPTTIADADLPFVDDVSSNVNDVPSMDPVDDVTNREMAGSEDEVGPAIAALGLEQIPPRDTMPTEAVSLSSSEISPPTVLDTVPAETDKAVFLAESRGESLLKPAFGLDSLQTQSVDEETQDVGMFEPPSRATSSTSLTAETSVDVSLDDDDFSDDIWEASLEAAQKSIDGTIVDLDFDDFVVSADEMVKWESAARLAKDLGQRSLVAEVDNDAVTQAEAAAARRAVEAYEQQRKMQELPRLSEKEESGTKPEMESFARSWNELSVSELKSELDLRGLSKSGKKAALVARLEKWDAVLVSKESTPPETASASLPDEYKAQRDWTYVKTSDLKAELTKRGLPAFGRKAELVAALEKSDKEQEQMAVVTLGEIADSFAQEKKSIASGNADIDEFDLFEQDIDPDFADVGPDLDVGFGLDDEVSPMGGSSFDKAGFDDIEELARAAREAVALFEASNSVPAFGGSPPPSPFSSTQTTLRDWSKLTVSELRGEARTRGLSVVGSKPELIAALESFDLREMSQGKHDDYDVDDLDGGDFLDDESLDEFDFNFDDIDMEKLGKAAREAVLLFESDDEPSDEALWAIENEIDQDGPIALSIEDPIVPELSDALPAVDYSSMAVSQLKDELNRRGLRVTGKKLELISRLQASDSGS